MMEKNFFSIQNFKLLCLGDDRKEGWGQGHE